MPGSVDAVSKMSSDEPTGLGPGFWSGRSRVDPSEVLMLSGSGEGLPLEKLRESTLIPTSSSPLRVLAVNLTASPSGLEMERTNFLGFLTPASFLMEHWSSWGVAFLMEHWSSRGGGRGGGGGGWDSGW